MSHTFYDSPDNAHPHISIDVTPSFAWFFQHTDADGNEVDAQYVTVRKEELPAIYKALGVYLGVEVPATLHSDLARICDHEERHMAGTGLGIYQQPD
jgi:hypothetical protein